MKKLLVDECVESYFRQIRNNEDCHIGLLIGRITNQQKDFVLRAIPTPAEEEDSAKCQSIESASQEWILEHAKQVSRMLVGGLRVVGLYSVGPGVDVKQMERLGSLAQVLQELAHSSLDEEVEVKMADAEGNSRCFLLCVNTQPFRYISKCLDLSPGAKSNMMEAVEVKGNQQTISKCVCLSCSFDLNSTLLLQDESSWEQELQSNIRLISQRIQDSYWSVNGESQSSIQAGKTSINACPLTGFPGTKVELYSPGVGVADELHQPTLCKKVVLQGTLACSAVVHESETVGAAVQALKDDICSSLRHRVSILSEEHEDLPKTLMRDGVQQLQLPMRVFLPHSDQASLHCDYILDRSDLDFSIQSFSEVLQVEVDSESFLCPEKIFEANSPSLPVASSEPQAISPEGHDDEEETCHQRARIPRNITLSLVVLLLVTVGLSAYFFSLQIGNNVDNVLSKKESVPSDYSVEENLFSGNSQEENFVDISHDVSQEKEDTSEEL